MIPIKSTVVLKKQENGKITYSVEVYQNDMVVAHKTAYAIGVLDHINKNALKSIQTRRAAFTEEWESDEPMRIYGLEYVDHVSFDVDEDGPDRTKPIMFSIDFINFVNIFMLQFKKSLI